MVFSRRKGRPGLFSDVQRHGHTNLSDDKGGIPADPALRGRLCQFRIPPYGDTADLPGLHLIILARKNPGGRIAARAQDKGIDVVFDGAGLKACGEGEWKARKYGAGKRRARRCLHMAVNPDNHDAIGAELTTAQTGEAEVQPGLLNQPECLEINNAYGDGASDTRGCYDAVAGHGGHAVMPPRRNAACQQAGHPRCEATAACRKHGRKAWKKASAVTAGASPKPLFTALSASSEPICQPAIFLVSVPRPISARRLLTA